MPAPRSESLTRKQLTDLLDRARTEAWTHLALFGPDSWGGYEASLIQDGWPADRVFRLSERLYGAGARALSTLTSVTSLVLVGNDIGDDGACALATLASLTSLILVGNDIGDD